MHVLTLLQGADAQVVGVASLPVPHAQQVAIVILDSQGFLHLFFTPLSTNVVVWDANVDAPAAGVGGTGQQGMSGTALKASGGAVPSQDPVRAVHSTGSGDHYASAVALLITLNGLHLKTCPKPSLLTHQCW